MNKHNAALVRHLRQSFAACSAEIHNTLKEIEHANNCHDSSMPEVQRAIELVSGLYKVSKEDIYSRRRDKDSAWARQVAMYLVKHQSTHSLTKIARSFGRHHANVLYAIESVKNRCDTDKRVKLEVEGLLNAF
jgi:hypothetical protein